MVISQIVQKAKVYVQGSAFNTTTRRTFLEARKYDIVENLKDASIVVWTGGEDIFPGLYNENSIQGVYYNKTRDRSDLEAVREAVNSEKFLVGICRGAQLLNCIPNGGRLWQDVDNHGSCIHKSFDCISGEYIFLNSVHHQALRVTDEAEIICWALESTEKHAEKEVWNKSLNGYLEESDKDIEVAWYPKTRSLLIQGHPEFGHLPTFNYFFSLMDRLYWRQQ